MRDMSTTEIVPPQTKPETEWIAGRAVPKVSPTRDHSRLQTKLAAALDAWADGRGEANAEPSSHATRADVRRFAKATFSLTRRSEIFPSSSGRCSPRERPR